MAFQRHQCPDQQRVCLMRSLNPDIGEVVKSSGTARSRGVRGRAAVNILKARCTGKTNLHNLEPEDLRVLTLPTRDATDVLLVGKH